MYDQADSQQTHADLEKVQDIIEQRLYELQHPMDKHSVETTLLAALLLAVKLTKRSLPTTPG